MPGLTEGNGPSYISSHSADVILSDIRPIQLTTEALRSINALLDEFLYSILSKSGSLSTDRLRASLLSLLPTNLGKEALLEAEVELRAYRERTGLVSHEDDSRSFSLQWAYELLRLKCEAYSTLNESYEDAAAELRINERMASTAVEAPKPSLVGPAALYLTAIVEAMCEHILSNVGRVAARDSSRTNANVNDLFIALSEDDSIYGLFKSMKVYEQIFELSKGAKSRRSKSFRGNNNSDSVTSLLNQDSSRKSSGSHPRVSGDGPSSVIMGSPTPSTARLSVEKGKGMKKFMSHTKFSSGDSINDSESGHKKNGSGMSGSQRHASHASEDGSLREDAAMLQEFDDLMRNASTMKVSLTPDRLKTMEVHQRKDEIRNRRPLHSTDPIASPPSLSATQRQRQRVVDSIIEDEEDVGGVKHSTTTRTRQISVATPPTTSVRTAVNRSRSVSTSGATPSPNRSARPSTAPSQSPVNPILMSSLGSTGVRQQRHLFPRNAISYDNYSPLPLRPKANQSNPDSLHFDDLSAGSDEDSPPSNIVLPLRSSSLASRQIPLSPQAQDLIKFLDDGPPDPVYPVSLPHEYHPNRRSIPIDTKPKGAGRLQRMLSKFTLGGDKVKSQPYDVSSRALQSRTAVTPNRSAPATPPQFSALSSLANKPIPPAPRSLTSRTTTFNVSFDEKPSVTFDSPPTTKGNLPDTLCQTPPPPPVKTLNSESPVPHTSADAGREPQIPNGGSNNAVVVKSEPELIVDTSVMTEAPTPSPKVLSEPNIPKHLSIADTKDIQVLLARATSAEECRLVFDMYLARAGIKDVEAEPDDLQKTNPPLSIAMEEVRRETLLELCLVESLLCGTGTASENTELMQIRAE